MLDLYEPIARSIRPSSASTLEIVPFFLATPARPTRRPGRIPMIEMVTSNSTSVNAAQNAGFSRRILQRSAAKRPIGRVPQTLRREFELPDPAFRQLLAVLMSCMDFDLFHLTLT